MQQIYDNIFSVYDVDKTPEVYLKLNS